MSAKIVGILRVKEDGDYIYHNVTVGILNTENNTSKMDEPSELKLNQEDDD